MSGARIAEMPSRAPRRHPGTAPIRSGFDVRLPWFTVSYARADRIVPVRSLHATGVAVRPCAAEIACRRVAHEVHGAPASIAEAYAAQLAAPIRPPPATLALCPDASVAAGIVQLADGTVLAESLVNTGADLSFTPFHRDAGGRMHHRRSRIGCARRLGDKPYVLLKQRWDANYGHWLVEALPRLACVDEHFRLGELGFIVSVTTAPCRRSTSSRSSFSASAATRSSRPARKRSPSTT